MEFKTDWPEARDEAERLAFDPDNRWYRLLKALTKASLDRARGRYLVSGQGFGCVSDVIADLWGSEPALMAMLERPEAVGAAVRMLVDVSKRLYDEMDALCRPIPADVKRECRRV